MPVKTQLCDAHGHVIEQVVFADLTVKSRIPNAAFKPEVATEASAGCATSRDPRRAAADRPTALERHQAAAGISHDEPLGAADAGRE